MGSRGPEKAKQSSESWAISARFRRRPARARHRGSRPMRARAPPRLDVVDIDHRSPGVGERNVGNDADHVRVLRMEGRLADLAAVDLDAGVMRRFEAFDQHEIDRRHLPQQIVDGGLGRLPQLVHQRPAPAGSDQHLGRAGDAVDVGILAGLVDVEAVMGVLDGGNGEAAPDQPRNDLCEQRGLSRPAPAGQSENAHGMIITPAGPSLRRQYRHDLPGRFTAARAGRAAVRPSSARSTPP